MTTLEWTVTSILLAMGDPPDTGEPYANLPLTLNPMVAVLVNSCLQVEMTGSWIARSVYSEALTL